MEEAGRENDSQEADAPMNKQPVWWSHETPCHPRQVLGQMSVKTTRMVHNYMSCFPHRASQGMLLIKHSWVHCNQLCIIHYAFLSMEDVFIIHTRQHFKLTRHKLVSKQHPSSVLVYSWSCARTIGSSRSVALGIVATFLLPRGLAEKCEKMWRQFFQEISSATTRHRGQALRPSGSTQGWEHRNAGAQRRLCQHLLPFQSRTYHEKKPFFDGRIHIDLSTTTPLTKARGKCWKPLDWLWISFNSQ